MRHGSHFAMPVALQSLAPRASSRARRSRAEASAETPLTAKQKRLIGESFLRFEPALDLVGQLFYLKLFRLDPSLRKRFAGSVEAQGRKFAAGMKLAMISLGHEDGLAPTLKLLGVRYRQLGIRARHYQTMAKALTWTLEQSLEKSFDRQTKEAWATLLGHVSRVMAG
jgi:hemoglobin-like flavoprotein